MARGARTRLERGIYQDQYGFSVMLTVNRRPIEQRFPPSTPRQVMRDWRRDAQTTYRRATPPKAERGSLEADIAKYLTRIRSLVSAPEIGSTLRAWLPLLGPVPRYRIKPDQVREIVNEWLEDGVKPKTVLNRLGALRRVYRVLDGRRAWCPVDEIDLPTVTTAPPSYVPAETVRSVYAKLVEGEQHGTLRDAKTRARFMVIASSGVRASELKRAKREDVDLERRVWRTRDGKGGYRPGGLYLTDDLLAAWRIFIEADAWGEFNTGSMAKVLRTAGWPAHIKPYALRASLGIALSESGADLADVASVLGHTSTDMTRSHYVPVIGSRVQAALEKVGSRIGWGR